MDRVVETVNTERCCTVMRPVTVYNTVQRDCGTWQTVTDYHPGPVVPQCVCDPCCGWKTCMVQCPGFTTCRRVWCPRVVCEQVPCTTYRCEVVRQQVPVQVCRMVPRTICEKIPVQVCRTVCQEVCEKYPVQRCSYVCEQMTQRVPVQTCRLVCEEHTRQVPVTTYRMVQEPRTCRVAFCVPTQVPYTVERCIPRCVCKNRAGDLHPDGGQVRAATGCVRGVSDGAGDRLRPARVPVVCGGRLCDLRWHGARWANQAAGRCRPAAAGIAQASDAGDSSCQSAGRSRAGCETGGSASDSAVAGGSEGLIGKPSS